MTNIEFEKRLSDFVEELRKERKKDKAFKPRTLCYVWDSEERPRFPFTRYFARYDDYGVALFYKGDFSPDCINENYKVKYWKHYEPYEDSRAVQRDSKKAWEPDWENYSDSVLAIVETDRGFKFPVNSLTFRFPVNSLIFCTSSDEGKVIKILYNFSKLKKNAGVPYEVWFEALQEYVKIWNLNMYDWKMFYSYNLTPVEAWKEEQRA